ncbi:MAG: hypothetical protein D6771_01105 [Zetaproteobacteria bacterium]|nr:MAG: hypothetical protein D6771_01105 [Zetaproteobacteria bacterium]
MGEPFSFEIWQARYREQAVWIARTLAEAFGCRASHAAPHGIAEKAPLHRSRAPTAPDLGALGIPLWRFGIQRKDDTLLFSPPRGKAAVGAILSAITTVCFAYVLHPKLNEDWVFGAMITVPLLITCGFAAYALYRQEAILDFRQGHYRIRKGFVWNVKEFHGTFQDILAVSVTESQRPRSGASESSDESVPEYTVAIEFAGPPRTCTLWTTPDKAKASRLAYVLAKALGCRIRWA